MVVLRDRLEACREGIESGGLGRQLPRVRIRTGCPPRSTPDLVVVLDKGRIVEEGAPATLIANGGRFAALLELEAAGWDWRDGA